LLHAASRHLAAHRHHNSPAMPPKLR
jgi:hypothetical protein